MVLTAAGFVWLALVAGPSRWAGLCLLALGGGVEPDARHGFMVGGTIGDFGH
jgi:hypothetical protein